MGGQIPDYIRILPICWFFIIIVKKCVRCLIRKMDKIHNQKGIKMHFNDYHYIATIAKHQSITRAAEELYISQPYLSKFLNNLERQYHTSFFNRTSYPITLTFAGERYLEYARRILDLETELKGSMQDIISGSAGTLTIGVPSSAGTFLLPYDLPVFQKR